MISLSYGHILYIKNINKEKNKTMFLDYNSLEWILDMSTLEVLYK
jgi:hypothetical protein